MFRLLLSTIILLFISLAHADKGVISLFPLENYDQTIRTWINPHSADYNQPLLSPDIQKKYFAIFQKKYFLPWEASFLKKILSLPAPDDMKTIQKEIIKNFSNTHKNKKNKGYGENFRPLPDQWMQAIGNNISLNQLAHLNYHKNNRAITIDNVYARVLPTEEPHFYNHTIAGEGYPFDNLQMSSIWAGTPIYIIAETKDHAWSLILTADYVAWVKSNGIVRVNDAFITKWKRQVKKQLAAITVTATPLLDESHHYLLKAYVGSVFPAKKTARGMIQLWVPAAKNQQAIIKTTIVQQSKVALMPYTITPHHMADIMRTLLNRPYGWGNLYFYNDCSAELKNLFTAFGIWLPRHSNEQVSVGKMIDLSSATPSKRISYLIEHGKKLLTLIYIGNHVVLYIGQHNNIAMTYQNMWGLKTHAPHPPKRAIVGQSVFFPLLLEYPEDKTLHSQAATAYFQMTVLDGS